LDYAWKLGYEEGKQQAERMDAAKPGEVEQIGHYAGEHKDGADLVSLYRDIPKGTPLFTAPPARVDGWQPIETAPKDQVILLGLPVAGNLHEDDRRVYEGRWHEAQQAWTSVNGFILFTGATHWMPLPPVPQSAKD
jgi:hypothetical protein